MKQKGAKIGISTSADVSLAADNERFRDEAVAFFGGKEIAFLHLNAGTGLGRGGQVQPSRPTGSSMASQAAPGTHPAVPVTLCQFLPAVLVAEGPCPICRQISNTP